MCFFVLHFLPHYFMMSNFFFFYFFFVSALATPTTRYSDALAVLQHLLALLPRDGDAIYHTGVALRRMEVKLDS
jgi:hypothetical protein